MQIRYLLWSEVVMLSWEGTPREIFSRVEEIKKYRLDVPQVTELAYELRNAGIRIPEGILTVNELVEAIEAAK